MLPLALMKMPPPEPFVVSPAVVAPPAVVTTMLSKSSLVPTGNVLPGKSAESLSSAPGVPVVLSVTVPEASKPVSREICSPAVTLTEELGPLKVTPDFPIVPPATTLP